MALVSDDWAEVHDLPVFSEGGVNVIELHVPPMRERRQDILPLARAFLAELTEHSGSQEQMRLSAAAEALLLQHAFPGNVRELENILERATVLATGPVIEAEHLQFNRPEYYDADAGMPKAIIGCFFITITKNFVGFLSFFKLFF